MRRIERPPARQSRLDQPDLLRKIKSTVLEKIIQTEESSYPYWDKWKYLAKEWKEDSKIIWHYIKSRRGSFRSINFPKLGEFKMFLNSPSIVQQQLHELDLGLGGSLQAGNLIPEEEKKYYLLSSLMEEAIASSQLEGAATTRKIAKEMLETNRKPRNQSEQMIVNNYEAMRWIVHNKNTEMTTERIRQIHHVITNKTLHNKNEEGEFRTHDDIHIVDVQTGTIVHTPPSHTVLDDLMHQYCLLANDDLKQDFFLHPVARAITLHFLMGYIHPFADGNGRTARALFYWYLIRKGYWLIEYMSVSRIILGSKAQYARAYQHTELDEMDLTYFLLYNLTAIRQAHEDLKKYIHKKSREKKNTLDLLRNTNYNERQISVLQEILNDDKNIFTVSQIEAKFEVSNQTARNDLNRLVEDGILQSRKNGKQIKFIPTPDSIKKISGK